MSLALYRKYRPATFAEVKGQEHATEPLQQALRNGRINHAYLFSGPRGCGKTTSARILARSLNCEKGPTPDPCGVCDSCVALGPNGGGSIDVIEIDAASHGGVDDARDLREKAFFSPVNSRFKVYIIDEAHMVTREGFNALLKLVEEPPPHLKFVFATTEPEKVIGTIRSRTHHYPFRLIPPGTLRELLEEVLGEEGVPYEPAALPLVVRSGAGSARDSLSILDQLLAGADENGITYDRAVSLLGYTDASLLDEVVDAFASGDGAAVFHAVDRVIEGGHDPRRFAADLLERIRDLVILAAVPDAGESGLLDVPPDQLEAMKSQAGRMGQAELTRAAEVFSVGLTEMRGATAPRLLLELMCARVLLPGASDDVAALLTRLERVERRLSFSGGAEQAAPQPPPVSRSAPAQQAAARAAVQAEPAQPPAAQAETASPPEAEDPDPLRTDAAAVAPRADSAAPDEPAQSPSRPASEPGQGAPPSARPPAAQSASGSLDVAGVRRAWPDVLEVVKNRRRFAWMILINDVQVQSLDGNVLTLGFARDGEMKGFVGSGCEAVVEEALKEVLAVSWRVVAALGGGGQGAQPTSPPPSAPPTPPAPPAYDPPPAPAEPSPPPAADPAPRTSSPPSPPRAEHPAVRPAPSTSPPSTASPAPEDEPDPDTDADADPAAEHLSGMALIQRELGATVIEEFDRA